MGEAIFFTIMIIATVSVLIIGYYAKRMNERERRYKSKNQKTKTP